MNFEKICFAAGVFILIFFYSIPCESQVTEEWSRTYNHIGIQDISNAIVLDNSGNVFVAGSVNNAPSTGTDYGTSAMFMLQGEKAMLLFAITL
ncbi:MAG TPA: SBBP repeat-containing protein [Ignavibacteria bacterium]|nr:SBBP repeat-containing protein [Ignavibacteria bacterium]